MGYLFLVLAGILAALTVLEKKAQGAYIDFGDSPPAPGPTAGEKTFDQQLDEIIAENAKRYKISPALIRAIIKVESNFNPNAANPSDPSYGLCQIMPILAEDYGIVRDWHNPTDAEIAMIFKPDINVRIAAWHLSRLLNKYTFDEAVQMYNVGESGFKQGRRNADYLSKVKRWENVYRA
jgi:soluble lytic murein transglycosylase-like protein